MGQARTWSDDLDFIQGIDVQGDGISQTYSRDALDGPAGYQQTTEFLHKSAA